ncbi:hypothetical protein PB1_10579 [Bacillus methanolicus PB1]|uniref:Uncharacterized protein n=1 Tax=Bacillus methanolicus PB1 TaxID=997296 RepID=I3DUT5_BACMT|nr:hypothetical protein PB1_10579 [Bacillus methanolicus PB1]
MDAWIEMIGNALSLMGFPVASYMDAWIEINM